MSENGIETIFVSIFDVSELGVTERLVSVISKCFSLPLTLNEIGQALFRLNDDSAPGIDGLPTSRYKVFYKKIKHFNIGTKFDKNGKKI